MKYKKTLVVLPARGGSKRIPYKNIKPINGHPMIYWPLKAIKPLFSPEQILISTDSDEIKRKVESIGLSVPFKRPGYLADDYTGIMDVVKHALDWYERNIAQVDYVVTIYPTAVLLEQKDIIAAMGKLASDKTCSTILSATDFAYPIQRAFFQNDQGFAQMFEPKNFPKRSQDLTPAYHDAGQFFISRAEAIRDDLNLSNSNYKIHALDRRRVIDIDTPEDFLEADEKLRFYGCSFKMEDLIF